MTRTLIFLTFTVLLGLAVAAIVLAISFAVDNYKMNKHIEYPPKKKKGGKQKMTNYFGKARLKKIFYRYISDRPKLVKAIKTDGKIYYEKFRGFEWLECYYEDYYFKISADGKKIKAIDLDEYHYNKKLDKNERFNRVFSY